MVLEGRRQWSPAGTYDRTKSPIATQAVSLQLPDPEDLGDVFVDEGLQRLAHLIKAKRGNQFSSTLLVHGLGRVLVRNEAFLSPVVIVLPQSSGVICVLPFSWEGTLGVPLGSSSFVYHREFSVCFQYILTADSPLSVPPITAPLLYPSRLDPFLLRFPSEMKRPPRNIHQIQHRKIGYD